MPVRNRRYETVAQLLFGALIALVLLNAVYNVLTRAVLHLLHK
jgi:hypothetical protein